jgi:hypothetical protein
MRKSAETVSAHSTNRLRFGPAQGSFAAFAFDERDGFRPGHGLSGVALVCRRQRRWKPKPQNFAANYCCSIHIAKLTYASLPSKRWIASLNTRNFFAVMKRKVNGALTNKPQ